nr:SIMPL domain-containing protein [uncultured Lacibacter sp.]
MKHLCFVVGVLLLAASAKSQSQLLTNPYPKTISVSGQAEMEIVPNEIYVQVDLKEFKKKGEEKVELAAITKEFLQNCKTAGIADSAISIASMEGVNSNDWWRKSKKDPTLLAGVSYQILFNDVSKMEKLIETLNEDATANFQIVKVWHTNMPQFKRQLKIRAIKAAKEKAEYLAQAVGEGIGPAVTITETEPHMLSPFAQYQYSYSNAIITNDKPSGDNSLVNFKKIKLEFSVSVVYALR